MIGSVVWEADSVHASIDALISVDITIEDYVYSLAEVGFESYAGGWETIGGKVTTVGGLASFTEDFGLIWNRFTHIPSAFTYGTLETLPIWDGSFNQFSIREAVMVPVPGPFSLLALGLVLTGLTVRSRDAS